MIQQVKAVATAISLFFIGFTLPGIRNQTQWVIFFVALTLVILSWSAVLALRLRRKG